MAHKETKSDKSLEQIELERRVDRMMDLSLPDPPQEEPAKPAAEATAAQPIDIFNDAKTAPDVSPELLEQIDTDNKEPARPSKPLGPEPPPPPPEQTEKHPQTAKKSAKPPPAGSKKTPKKARTLDEAVDDIIRAESDELLTLEDAAHSAKSAAVQNLAHHKTAWLLVALIVILLIVLL